VNLNIKYKWNDGPWLILKDKPETSITICWITSKRKSSFLVWGDSKSNININELTSIAENHTVTIKNLTPDTMYFYTIKEDFTLYPEGTIFSFYTAKEKGIDKDLEFIIAGDLQPKNEFTLNTNSIMAAQINRENPDFIVQMGDLVQIGSFTRYWHYLMKSLPVMASSRPIFPVIGNHDYYLFHKNNNFRTFFPFNFSGEKSSYHSKNIGLLHLVFLDPYDGGFEGMGSRITEKQKTWFIKDLENAIDEGVEWIFIFLHQAVLSSGEYPGDIKLQKWLLPLLSKFNVDAVFWGHAHIYEHWKYQYGKNGYVIDENDAPCKNTIDFFCIGSSGARLESKFRLFTHKPFRRKLIAWFNIKRRAFEKRITIQYPWSREVFFEGKLGIDKFEKEDNHYYHLPLDKQGIYSEDPGISYNTENKWFGYMYGENTIHYAKVKVDNSTCTISIHYADGSLLAGPDGTLPQEFTLKKKERNNLMWRTGSQGHY
jgi:hypothetical protein